MSLKAGPFHTLQPWTGRSRPLCSGKLDVFWNKPSSRLDDCEYWRKWGCAWLFLVLVKAKQSICILAAAYSQNGITMQRQQQKSNYVRTSELAVGLSPTLLLCYALFIKNQYIFYSAVHPKEFKAVYICFPPSTFILTITTLSGKIRCERVICPSDPHQSGDWNSGLPDPSSTF